VRRAIKATTKANGKAASPTHKIAPGPRGVIFLGSLPDIRKDQLRMYVDAWREFGDVVRFRLGPLTAHLIAQPDHIHHVLVEGKENYSKGIAYEKLKIVLGLGLFTSEGELWRRQRRLMQPLFTARAITKFAPSMTGATEDMLSRWRPYAERGEAKNINFEMMRLTMSIIGRTMLGLDLEGEATETGRAFTFVLDYATHRTISLVNVPLFIPTPLNRRFNEARRTLDSLIYNIIEDRRRRKESKNDLLSMLLDARDEESGERMGEKQIRDEVIIIFFAGHETTAQALSWTWYLLSKHTEVERRLHAELDSVLGGRAPTVDDLPNLNYTRMVIEESMRLYPPVWIFARDAIRDDEIGGYHIPAGSMVLMSQYITHRHPDFWENPEGFDPERFTEERSKNHPHYTYFPFGGGPRICIGNSFAMMEAQLILATVAQSYRLHLMPGYPVEPVALGTLRPRYNIVMTLHPR